MFNMMGVRLDPPTERRLRAAAKRRRCSKSTLVREAIHRYLAGQDLEAEARRQSLLVSGDRAEHAAIAFVEAVATTEDSK